MNRLYEPIPKWHAWCLGYAMAWGYRSGSGIAKLIDHVRDEHRLKYAWDFRLLRVGKNKYKVVPAVFADSVTHKRVELLFGRDTLIQHAPEFLTTIV